MNSIIQQITDWLKGLLVSGIMNNLTNTFSSVNDQVGQIATEVGQTPSSFLPAVFNMVRNLSETVIMPIAGILLTFIACYELIQLIISYNNLASFETWFIFKWIFKTFVAVELITHTFDITMAVFDVSQSVVSRAGGIIQGSTAIDASTLATMQTTLEAMDLGPLLGIFLQSFVVQFLMYILAAIIFVIINGRMVEDLSRVQKRRCSSKGGVRAFWEPGFSKPVKKSIKDVKSVTLASSDLPRRETTRGTIAYRKNRKLGKPSTHD